MYQPMFVGGLFVLGAFTYDSLLYGILGGVFILIGISNKKHIPLDDDKKDNIDQ